ncbi:MAG: hypothetical protein IPL20_15560 [Saprospiraceae bacterium]|nr:hypothetical protein [Saprospiraceae bacterium]
MLIRLFCDSGHPVFNEAMEVYGTVTNNTPEQIEIAKYWADDPFMTCTPAGHTFNILTQVMREERVSLAKAAMSYARMCIAEMMPLSPAGRQMRLLHIRPVTYIKRYIDPNFNTVIGTTFPCVYFQDIPAK